MIESKQLLQMIVKKTINGGLHWIRGETQHDCFSGGKKSHLTTPPCFSETGYVEESETTTWSAKFNNYELILRYRHEESSCLWVGRCQAYWLTATHNGESVTLKYEEPDDSILNPVFYFRLFVKHPIKRLYELVAHPK